MTPHGDRRRRRLLQLLADHATESLGPAAMKELRELLTAYPQYDEHYFEAAAAAIDVAMAPRRRDPLPDNLRKKLLTDGGRLIG